MRSRCVVFDLDDTLYLERDYVRSGFEALDPFVRREFAVDDFAERAWREFLSGARGDIFNRVLSASPSQISELVRRYREHAPEISLLPDASEVLDVFSGSARLALVTDGASVSQRAKINALRLDARDLFLVVTDELGPGCGKPSRTAFECVERECGVRGTECVYVADNPRKDFLGPKALGWRTVRVRRAGQLHVNVASGSDVDVEVSDLSRLTDVLENFSDRARNEGSR